jgi:hypothetical protein
MCLQTLELQLALTEAQRHPRRPPVPAPADLQGAIPHAQGALLIGKYITINIQGKQPEHCIFVSEGELHQRTPSSSSRVSCLLVGTPHGMMRLHALDRLLLPATV